MLRPAASGSRPVSERHSAASHRAECVRNSRETLRFSALVPSDSVPAAERRCSRTCRSRLFLFKPPFSFLFSFFVLLSDSPQTVKHLVTPSSGVPIHLRSLVLLNRAANFGENYTATQPSSLFERLCDIFGLTPLSPWGRKPLSSFWNSVRGVSVFFLGGGRDETMKTTKLRQLCFHNGLYRVTGARLLAVPCSPY